jgi:hypothetical protein
MAADPDENMERGLMIMARLKENNRKKGHIIAFHSDGYGGFLRQRM